ncbi:hypothetical protein FE257_000682 [Aspergillus nanangensis]|uniref:Peptidase S1 domain-containing protein n=1 Tax=Aspergillus nanangensis TaxID=2582783 RepID=A0AAD4CER4_ASPNN|nr:hypothetical protein FE257_000682 [Aspergillus nanangensis]
MRAFLLIILACLAAISHAIVGGEDVDKGTFPYVVSVQEDGWTGSVKQLCGGFIVKANKVVTAADCVDGLVASKLRVLGGDV